METIRQRCKSIEIVFKEEYIKNLLEITKYDKFSDNKLNDLYHKTLKKKILKKIREELTKNELSKVGNNPDIWVNKENKVVFKPQEEDLKKKFPKVILEEMRLPQLANHLLTYTYMELRPNYLSISIRELKRPINKIRITIKYRK